MILLLEQSSLRKMNNLKLPPQDIEAEKTVLGSLMIDTHAITKVADTLSSQDFYSSSHQRIYSSIIDLFNKSEPIDILSITNNLKTKNELEGVGGSSYLTELINVVPSSAHIAHYARMVREKRVLRDLISVGAEINENVFESSVKVENLIDQIEQRIFLISQKSQDKSYINVKEELHSAIERIEKLHQEGNTGLRGVTTGFDDIDFYLSGLQKSDLIILGARPSLGKTTLALDMARNAASKGKVPVALFSIEMSSEQIIDRLISAEAQVPLWKLRTGRLDEAELQLIQMGAEKLSGMEIFVDDTPSPNIMQIRSISRRLQTEHGIGLIVVDYVQLISPMGSGENVVQQFTEISHGLKALARELNIPVLAISQLNRSVDQREIKMPRLSDLRETGSLEQDADVVLFIYRKDKDKLEPSLEEENTASIVIAKHRNGPTGVIDLKFDPEKVTFKQIDKRRSSNEVF